MSIYSGCPSFTPFPAYMLEKTGRKQHLIHICALNLISWTPPVKRFMGNFSKNFSSLPKQLRDPRIQAISHI